jgi:hypothetical protein
MILTIAIGAGDGAARSLKGNGPTSIAAAFGSIWIGLGNGEVVRIDARSGREQARFRGPSTAFVRGVVAAYGAVWALRDDVVRIDPRRNVAPDVPRVGSATLSDIQAGAGAIWVVDNGSSEILRIDPKRSDLVARVRALGPAWAVAAGRGGVIVVTGPDHGPVTGPEGPRFLHRLDPRTNELSAPLARVGCEPLVTLGAGVVWTFDFCNGVLARRDPNTLRVVRQTKTGVLSQRPAVGFGSVWLASRGSVRRIDPVTLRVVARIPARSLEVVIGDGYVWALDNAHFVVRKIDPRTNRVVARFRVGTKS